MFSVAEVSLVKASPKKSAEINHYIYRKRNIQIPIQIPALGVRSKYMYISGMYRLYSVRENMGLLGRLE